MEHYPIEGKESILESLQVNVYSLAHSCYYINSLLEIPCWDLTQGLLSSHWHVEKLFGVQLIQMIVTCLHFLKTSVKLILLNGNIMHQLFCIKDLIQCIGNYMLLQNSVQCLIQCYCQKIVRSSCFELHYKSKTKKLTFNYNYFWRPLKKAMYFIVSFWWPLVSYSENPTKRTHEPL